MMRQAILDFPKQFSFNPRIINAKPKKISRYCLIGMGGSHLAGGILLDMLPGLNLKIHRDYGLPTMSKAEKRQTLFIFSSYSGNTEEVLHAYDRARREDLNLAVITVGGKLQKRSERDRVPLILLPNTGIQPRSALGFSLLALSKLAGQHKFLRQMKTVGQKLNPNKQKQVATTLAKKLYGKIPIIYTDNTNAALAYNWKIKLNETGKIPAFFNLLPELNHNEMTGFDRESKDLPLAGRFAFVFLNMKSATPKIKARFGALKSLLDARGLETHEINAPGWTLVERLFNSLLIADWTALSLATAYGFEPEAVPMVEEFKGMLEG